jgi:hypothetical protein
MHEFYECLLNRIVFWKVLWKKAKANTKFTDYTANQIERNRLKNSNW